MASAQFASRGYDATSMSDIANQLGVTKAALYRHTRGKAALLRAVTHVTCAALLALTTEVTADPFQGTALERVGQLLRGVLELSDTDPFGSKLVWGSGEAAATEPLASCRAGLYDCVLGLLMEARDEGSLRPSLDPRMTGHLLLGAVASLVTGSATSDARAPVAGSVVELLLNGLGSAHRFPPRP